LISSASR
jgi:hypothetical protein